MHCLVIDLIYLYDSLFTTGWINCFDEIHIGKQLF